MPAFLHSSILDVTVLGDTFLDGVAFDPAKLGSFLKYF